MNGGDDWRRDQPRVGERQEVETVVNDVELRCPLEHLRNVEAFGNLWIDGWIFGPTSGHHASQNGRCFRVARGEERHVVPPGDEPLGQQLGKELPRPVVAWRDAPRDRCEYRNAHPTFNAPGRGCEPCCLEPLASPFLLPSSP